MSERAEIGTRVTYRGGTWVVQGYSDLDARQDLTPSEKAEGYPDGVAYELWPEGVPVKFGERGKAVYFVRQKSFEVLPAKR